MATRRYYSANAIDSTVFTAINNSATSVVLSSTPTGYPSSYPYVLALDYNAASEELVLVTAASGATLTITRGFNGTSAQAHGAGAVVRHVIVAQDLTDFQDHAAATTSVHGITDTSALATKTGAETLTNKTLTSPVVNTPKTTLDFNAQSGTTYTLVLTDQDKLVTLNNSSAITLTIPAGVFSKGQYVNIQQLGSGQVTIQGDGTSTFTSTGTRLRVQYSAATIVCTGTNTFTALGDLV